MIQIDCKGIKNKQQLHILLQEKLAFPAWYGQNLDALMDCLTEIGEQTQICLAGFSELGEWKTGFERVFTIAMEENPDLQITLL